MHRRRCRAAPRSPSRRLCSRVPWQEALHARRPVAWRSFWRGRNGGNHRRGGSTARSRPPDKRGSTTGSVRVATGIRPPFLRQRPGRRSQIDRRDAGESLSENSRLARCAQAPSMHSTKPVRAANAAPAGRPPRSTFGGGRLRAPQGSRRSCPARTSASPRMAVFLQHADVGVLHRLLDSMVNTAGTPPERIGTSVH